MAASVTEDVQLDIANGNSVQKSSSGLISPCQFATVHDVQEHSLVPTGVDPPICIRAMDTFKMLSKFLERDVLACDLQWSLFVSALISYRRDTVLRPFPAGYNHVTEANASHGGSKDFEKLRTIADGVQSFHQLLLEGEGEKYCKMHTSLAGAELLLWVLNPKSFSVKSVDQSMFSTIKEKTGQIVNAPVPTHVFEIVYSEVIDSKFNKSNLIYAYHGSRVENFHSILRNGLRNHMNKNSVFGEGTYLSSELSVCMPFSPTGLGWGKSFLGEKISCIAVCEIIPHPDVKCHTKKEQKPGHSARRWPSEWIGNGVPERYYIVQNDELIRVKYLLVYANDFSLTQDRRRNVVKRAPKNWFSEHRFIIMIVSYCVILVAVGFGDTLRLKSLFKKSVP